jgi:hypothetical protein
MVTERLKEWDGKLLSSGCLGVFAATTLVAAPSAVPMPLFLAVSSPRRRCVVGAEAISDFLTVHAKSQIACFDAGELHWILHEHLIRSASSSAFDFRREAFVILQRNGRLRSMTILELEPSSEVLPRAIGPKSANVSYMSLAADPTRSSKCSKNFTV